MLYLRAGFSDKLNCDYSIFVTFKYNPNYVELVKSMPKRVWNGDNKEWEVAYECYSQLIGTLNAYNIPYNASQFMQSIKELQNEVQKLQTIQKQEANVDASILDNVEFKTNPYPYQREGIAYGLQVDNFLNADDQGLGKTLQCINIARLKRGGQHCLVIVGYDALQFNWVKEIGIHSNETAKVLGQKLNRKGRYVAGSIKERLEDLQNLDKIEEFFIVTTVTTLRQCIKTKYVDKNGKTKTHKDFYMADLIEHWCRKGVIGRIIYDEIQTCVHGNTQVTCGNQRIAVNKLYKQFQKNPNLYINSYNIQTGLVESKKILEMTKSETEVSFIRLHLEHEGLFTELTVTPEHKILTNNRGWVEAQDLEDTDDIVVDPKWFNNNKYVKKQCDYCGSIFVTTDKDKRFCDGSCAAYWRFENIGHPSTGLTKSQQSIEKQKRSLKQNTQYMEKLRNRMINNNPSQKQHIREKIKQTKSKNNPENKWIGLRGGNGTISSTEQLIFDFMTSKGFLYNAGIGTKEIKQIYPEENFANVYKPDFYHPQLKLAIEVDGHSHLTKLGKLRDAKKEKCLEYYGITIKRFTNEYITNNLQKFKKEIEVLCRSQN